MSAGIKNREELQPALIAPTRPGYMPLYCAAQWIATAGHATPWDLVDASVWERAYRDLRDAIASEEVKVVGVIKGRKMPVPPHLFQGCEISHVGNLSLPAGDDDYYLASSPYIEASRPEDRVWDMLVGRNGLPRWDQLHVRNQDVERLWPFEDRSASIRTVRTGMRGRPTSKAIIEKEHIARWARGEALLGVAEESRALLAWLVSRHPDAERPTAKTIEENIRSAHRARRAKTGK